MAKNIDPSELNIDLSFVSGSASGAEQSEFYYNGIPDGKYSVSSVNLLTWIINAIKEIVSFLINIITYVIRMVFVGWTFLVENMVTDTIKNITGEEEVVEIDATDYGETGNKYTNDNITIEKIIFNKVKVFDIDFFGSDTEETEETEATE